MTSAKITLSVVILLTVILSSSLCKAEPIHQSGATTTDASTTHGASTPKMSVDLDTTGIAKSTKVEIVPASPYYPDDEIIQLSGAPMHIRVLFDGKKSDEVDFNQPNLLIYPLQEYAAMFPGKAKVVFNKLITDLKKMISTKSEAGLEDIPVLPESDAAQRIHSKTKFLKFKSGSGVSFVSVYGNGDPAYKPDDFFYTFQGITSDGKHYVSFFWPVKATGLPPNSSQPKAEKYLAALQRTKFVPSLDLLDNVVSSISLK